MTILKNLSYKTPGFSHWFVFLPKWGTCSPYALNTLLTIPGSLHFAGKPPDHLKGPIFKALVELTFDDACEYYSSIFAITFL